MDKLPRGIRGETLLRIPDALFIPVSQLTWPDNDGVLGYTGDVQCLSHVQHHMLDAMVELYNATDKINKLPARFPDACFATIRPCSL